MERIDLENLKKIQLQILEYFDKFCQENDIKYWLDCGTLLGAIRHKGYIPWDDDIDVGMLRKDYEKLISLSSLFNDNNKYKFNCYEKNKNWKYSFGKVLDIDTLLYEPDIKHGIKTCVNIDIFVYDNAPADEVEFKHMCDKRDLLIKLHSCQNIKRFYTEEKQKYNFLRYPIHYLLNIFPKDYFVKKIINNSKKLLNIKTGYISNFMLNTKMRCSTDVFKSFMKVEFEGKKFPAPEGYDKLLTSFYGDYMTLPPKEKQKSHHIFEAYYSDKSEKL